MSHHPFSENASFDLSGTAVVVGGLGRLGGGKEELRVEAWYEQVVDTDESKIATCRCIVCKMVVQIITVGSYQDSSETVEEPVVAKRVQSRMAPQFPTHALFRYRPISALWALTRLVAR